jgi:hypothetical protein
MEHPSTIYPYGLVNAASEYMVHVSDLFLLELPEIDHPAPVVNMVDIRQIDGD